MFCTDVKSKVLQDVLRIVSKMVFRLAQKRAKSFYALQIQLLMLMQTLVEQGSCKTSSPSLSCPKSRIGSRP